MLRVEVRQVDVRPDDVLQPRRERRRLLLAEALALALVLEELQEGPRQLVLNGLHDRRDRVAEYHLLLGVGKVVQIEYCVQQRDQLLDLALAQYECRALRWQLVREAADQVVARLE